jgi:hypothetical protein
MEVAESQLRRAGDMGTKRQTARRTEGSGKVEIQNQDSHFSTAPAACGAKKKDKKNSANPKAIYTKVLTPARGFESHLPLHFQ